MSDTGSITDEAAHQEMEDQLEDEREGSIDQGSLPRNQGSLPRHQGSLPRPQGSLPRGSLPRGRHHISAPIPHPMDPPPIQPRANPPERTPSHRSQRSQVSPVQTNHVHGGVPGVGEDGPGGGDEEQDLMDEMPDSYLDNEEKPLSQISYSWRKDQEYRRKCR